MSEARAPSLGEIGIRRTARSSGAPGISITQTLPALGVAAFAFLFLLTWPKEFLEPDGEPSVLYSNLGLGLRIMDAIVLGMFWVVLTAKWSIRKWAMPPFPVGVRRASAAFAASVGIAVVYGAAQGGTELFHDWRNIFLGWLFGLIIFNLIQTDQSMLRAACGGLFVVIASKTAMLMALFWAHSTQTFVFDVRVPVYDGPTLHNAVFVALVGSLVGVKCQQLSLRARAIWLSGGVLSALMVVLAFRRTFWAELLAAALAIAIFDRRRRGILLAALGLVAIVAYSQLGPLLGARIESSNPFNFEGPYGETNEGHVSDVLDAWDVIKGSPLLGVGVGSTYETNRIAGWKTESWGVHNAVLHVWLRYGVIGAISYIGAHLGLFAWLLALRRRLGFDSFEKAWITGSLAYLMGVFVVGLGFSPWPYGGFQTTGVIFALLLIAAQIERLASGRQLRRVGSARGN